MEQDTNNRSKKYDPKNGLEQKIPIVTTPASEKKANNKRIKKRNTWYIGTWNVIELNGKEVELVTEIHKTKR